MLIGPHSRGSRSLVGQAATSSTTVFRRMGSVPRVSRTPKTSQSNLVGHGVPFRVCKNVGDIWNIFCCVRQVEPWRWGPVSCYWLEFPCNVSLEELPLTEEPGLVMEPKLRGIAHSQRGSRCFLIWLWVKTNVTLWGFRYTGHHPF